MKTTIVPVQFWPDYADTIVFQNGTLVPPPVYSYTLTNSTGKNFKTAAIQMSQEAWNAWPAGLGPDGDVNYQLDSLCKQLNLTRT